MSTDATGARSSILRLDSGADLVTDWFGGATQPQKNVVSRILFAIAECSVFASFTVVDDTDDHMAFFVLASGDITVKARINDFETFDVLYIGSSCAAPGLDRAPSARGRAGRASRQDDGGRTRLPDDEESIPGT
jgi:hypothetical protein